MKMWKLVIVSMIGIVLSMPLCANNVKIVGDVKVLPKDIVGGKKASFSFTVEWENSWRDEFNYDAVYVFLKYKLDEDKQEWNHLFLGNDLKVTGTDGTPYEFELLNPTGTADRNVGMMIWRKGSGYGKSSVKIEATWDITSNSLCPLQSTHFDQGKVFMSAMAIEMVHVPQVAFRVGDSKLKSKTDSLRFRHRYMPIPEKWDEVSEEYTIETKDNKVTPGFLPQYAANHTNDVDRTNRTNAWVGNGESDQYWRIDFGTRNGQATGSKKTIRYFAIEGVTGYVPEVWQLQGFDTPGEANPAILYEGTAADWVTTSNRVYPATKALKIKSPKAFRYYSIYIKTLGAAQGPAIKTISMTEKDLATEYDNSVLIQEPTLKLSDEVGSSQNVIYTSDGDMTGTITNVYPHGFYGFFAMKYEISQEQYVAFLNKLNLAQQNVRTVGEKLVGLKEGNYVFGDNPLEASARNGIILASRLNSTSPVVFANNLNKNDEYAQDGDGQTLACNYLTPADMLAYADWAGLRPLSELEYEKMARQPYPAVPLQGEYAWSSTTFTPPAASSAIQNSGKRSESLTSGNANGNNILAGPVRCGAFAKAAGSQQASGVSFWGFADMSGNLAEIYYNLNTEGRKFAGLLRTGHGNGAILSNTGESDINAGIWPINGNAFALRGGSYKSLIASAELEVSDRSKAKGNYEAGLINVRKSDVTFRVGCSMEKKALWNTLTLRNGLQTTETAGVADTICSGEDYVVRGDIPAGIEGAYTILWLYAGNNGVWYHIEGENGKDLYLKNLRNANTADGVFTEYSYKRHIYSSQGYAFSQPVTLRVVNTQVDITPREINVGVAATSSAITVKSKLPMTVKWQFRDNPMEDLRKVITANKSWEHTPVYQDFTYAGIVNSGKQPLVFYHQHYNKFCPARDTVWVNVQKTDGSVANSEDVICGQTFVDARDATNTYTTVGIGTQCWMVENLNYAVSGSKCYNNDETNCRIYGRLYNWSQTMNGRITSTGSPQVQGVCPKGWHVPTNEEWGPLVNMAGTTVKRQEWNGSTNTSGFSALPGGGVFAAYTVGISTYGETDSRNGVYDLGVRGWWWTATSNHRHWTTNYNHSSYNYTIMPYYVSMGTSTGITQNKEVSWNQGYLNSIFCSSNFTHFAASLNSSGWNSGYNYTAYTYMVNEFYFSVRCVRDKSLTPGEK